MNSRFSAIALAALFFAACNSAKDSSAPANGAPNSATPAMASRATSPPATAKAKVDVCGLLTSDDLKKVQGESYKDAQRSDRQEGESIVAQCYYALPTTANSVVLNVTTAKDGASAAGVRQTWERMFEKAESKETSDKGREGEKDRDQKNKAQARDEEGEREEAAKPEKVNGLGDEAFWVGSRVGGALYVLKKDQFFRLSVGGAGDQKTKLNKSKNLAQLVLKKL